MVIWRALRSTLFPYTTLFRSEGQGRYGNPLRADYVLEYRNTNRARSAIPILVYARSEEHTSELQSRFELVCRLLLEKKNNKHLARHLRHRTTQHPVELGRAQL